MTVSNRFQVFPMVLPSDDKGPLTVPDRIEFTAGETQEIDLQQLVDNGWLSYVGGVYVDNFDNAGDITLLCNGSNQKFIIPAGCAGYYPLLLPNPPKVNATMSVDGVATFQWYNVPVFPMIIAGPNSVQAGSNINIAEVGGIAITDGNLPVINTGPTITDYSAAMTGADQEIITVGQAAHYLLIYNPIGNGDVTINLAGGDASASGFPLIAGGQYEALNGIANAVHIDGTNAENITVFAG